MPDQVKLACIFLASGLSRRFQGNKLLADFGGRPMIETVFANFPSERFHQTVVVTRYAPVAILASRQGFSIAENDDPAADIANTIRMGLSALRPGLDGCLFSVCDQPLLRAESVGRLVETFAADPSRITALAFHGRRGNPVIFPCALFDELATLAPDESGSTVIARHPNLLTLVEVSERRELIDVDCRADLPPSP